MTWITLTAFPCDNFTHNHSEHCLNVDHYPCSVDMATTDGSCCKPHGRIHFNKNNSGPFFWGRRELVRLFKTPHQFITNHFILHQKLNMKSLEWVELRSQMLVHEKYYHESVSLVPMKIVYFSHPSSFNNHPINITTLCLNCTLPPK